MNRLIVSAFVCVRFLGIYLNGLHSLNLEDVVRPVKDNVETEFDERTNNVEVLVDFFADHLEVTDIDEHQLTQPSGYNRLAEHKFLLAVLPYFSHFSFN